MLPMSIGLGSTNITLRGMADYQWGNWFATLSGSYVWRSNVELDRTAYYTTEMHNTSEVKMPNALQWNLRAGYRYGNWIVEGVLDDWTTLGGHDITRNNMPFISNRMNATRLGVNIKWENVLLNGLSLITGGNTTISGRNMGQANTSYASVVYIFDFTRKDKSEQHKL
jgi:hypothetical protein